MKSPDPPMESDHASLFDGTNDGSGNDCCGRLAAASHDTPQMQFCFSLQGAFFCFSGTICWAMPRSSVCMDGQSHGLGEAKAPTAGAVAIKSASANIAATNFCAIAWFIMVRTIGSSDFVFKRGRAG
jgi:hypothetical protein